jgi:hypothetical protein
MTEKSWVHELVPRLSNELKCFDSRAAQALARLTGRGIKTPVLKERDTVYAGHFLRCMELLLALRDHTTIKERPMFPGEQATLRDAYDAFLAFVSRLELSISTQLIDAKPAKAYFAYWLRHFLTFDKHPDVNKVLKRMTSSVMVAEYIKVYGDPGAVKRLCEEFSITPPVSLVRRAAQE